MSEETTAPSRKAIEQQAIENPETHEITLKLKPEEFRKMDPDDLAVVILNW